MVSTKAPPNARAYCLASALSPCVEACKAPCSDCAGSWRASLPPRWESLCPATTLASCSVPGWYQDPSGLVGHIRVFAALGSFASVTILLHSVLIDPLWWILLRLLSGFCFSGLYLVA